MNYQFSSEGSKQILILGGSGFIGTALRRHLRGKGYRLHIIGRALEIVLNENEVYYSVVEYTYLHLGKILKENNFYAIIDLAYTSVPGTSYSDPVKDFSENLYTVIKHLELCKILSARMFIYVSSGGTVYGESGKELIPEDEQNFPLSPYGVTKMACERYVYMYHKSHHIPSIIVRPPNIYGPGQRPFRGQGLIATALGLAYQNKPIQVYGDGSHIRDYLFIDDFCSAIALVIAAGQPGNIYNVGSQAGVSIQSILDYINFTVEKEGYYLQQINLEQRPFDVHHNVLDCSRFSRLGAWKPDTNIKDGIFKTWEWIKEYMKHSH